MDNRQRYGFRPYRTSFGEFNPAPMVVADSYQGNPGALGNIDLNRGDAVVMVSTGTMEHCAVSGVIWGVMVQAIQWWDASNQWIWNPGYNNKIPGGTTSGGIADRASKIAVLPSPGTIFEIDCDDNVTATTRAGYQALVGENCDISYNTVTATKMGWPMLDISTHGAPSAQCRIIDISPTLENVDFSGKYVKLLVEINKTQYPGLQTAGI